MDRGLLVDYGGVLTTSVVESWSSFCRAEGIDPETFRRVALDAARTPDSPFTRVEVGAIDQEEFDREFAALLSEACGVDLDPRGLKQRLFAGAGLDPAMVRAVRMAREAGIRTVLVSNSWGGNDYPMDLLGELFDALVISGHVGMRKPDREIYLHAARSVGLPPAACVFVDDFATNVRGAEAVGMRGIHHRTAAETIPLLEEMLGAPLRSPDSLPAGR